MASDRPSQPITWPGRSTGMKSSEFISATHTNTVNASGAMNVRVPWIIDFDWSSTISTSISIAHWKRPGTPDVALRAARCRMMMVARPQTIDQNRVSRFHTWMSKIDVWCPVEKFCKWCAMYSDGSIARVPSLAAISLKPPKLSKIVLGRSRRKALLRERAGCGWCDIRTLSPAPCASFKSLQLPVASSAPRQGNPVRLERDEISHEQRNPAHVVIPEGD